ncbi:cholecystokinin receptor type A-like [Arctopsyche grandis]|uniref:cholecystokinin receptor type A-like n=1 Tax=Arctopsyche grandis TaxID=121162 RepID=UPI00406D94C4
MEFTGGTSPYPASPTFVTFNPHYLNELANDSTTDANSTDWSMTTVGDAAVNKTVGSAGIKSVGVFESQLIIPLYATIFLLAVVGNSLVVITLAQNKRMRTVTNVYLLNLAISDLLLGVFCMPFTLVGQVLRNFVFGPAMCKLIPYIQAVSVSVGVWTLVAISLERYFAICRPLKSRRWQTQFHAYKMIAVVWIASLAWNSPILVVSTLKAMRGRAGHKCREEWPSTGSEQAYNLFLDVMLLLIPLLIMSLAYSLIVSKLWKGLKREIKHNSSCQRQMERSYSSATMNGVTLIHQDPNNCSPNNSASNLTPITPLRQHRLSPSRLNNNANGYTKRGDTTFTTKEQDNKNKGSKSVKIWLLRGMMQVSIPAPGKTRTGLAPGSMRASRDGLCHSAEPPVETTYTFTRHAIRSNYMDKSIEAKKNVIRMLFVIIAEFFICWAPLHVLNTVYLFSHELVYKYVGSTGVALVQLLAYVSSCCNPITYCFMNKKFRQAFLAIFDCYRCLRCRCNETDIYLASYSDCVPTGGRVEILNLTQVPTVSAVLKVHAKGLRVVLRAEDLPEAAETLPKTYLTFPVTTLPFTWVEPAPFADLHFCDVVKIKDKFAGWISN